MPPKRANAGGNGGGGGVGGGGGGGGGACNAFQRQNLLHLKEQQLLNREQQREAQAAQERKDRVAQRLRARYGAGGGTAAQRTTPVPAGQASAAAAPFGPLPGGGGGGRGEKIEVFIRETDPAFARHYAVHEGSGPGGGGVGASSEAAEEAETAAGGGGGGSDPAAPAVYHTGDACPAARACAAPLTDTSAPPPRCGKPAGTAGAARRAKPAAAAAAAASAASAAGTPAAAAAAGAATGRSRQVPQSLSSSSPSPSASAAAASTPDRRGRGKPGQVPAYLTKRKQELQEEKDLCQQRAEQTAQRAQYPPGQVPLEQADKTEILKGLGMKKNELMSELNKLPMRFDTTTIKKRRADIELQIRDIEGKEALFSRKLVYVPGS